MSFLQDTIANSAHPDGSTFLTCPQRAIVRIISAISLSTRHEEKKPVDTCWNFFWSIPPSCKHTVVRVWWWFPNQIWCKLGLLYKQCREASRIDVQACQSSDHPKAEMKFCFTNTSYLTVSDICFTLKLESVSKITIFGLKMVLKRGLEIYFLKFLHLEAILF